MSADDFRTELRELFRLALPLAAAQAGTQLMGIVDIAVLGRLGARELAASSIANAIFFAVSVFGLGTVLGVDPLISQALGAGDPARARRALWQGIWLAAIVTIFLTVVLACGAWVMPLFASRDLVAPARAFLLIRTASLLPFMVFYVCRSYLQAHGITRPLVAAMVIANILNFLGDLLFVFGGSSLPAWWGPIQRTPPMGVAGAAWSTLICTFVEVAVLIPSLRRTALPGAMDHRLYPSEVAVPFRIGLPVGLHMGAEVGVFALVALLAARLGIIQVAAHQLVIGLASFTFTIALGVASAGTVRVGRAVGARDVAGTRRAGHAAFAGGLIVMGVGASIFALAPRMVARLITNQTAIVEASVPLLLIAAVFQLFDGTQAVGAGALRGAGDTRFTLWANLFGHWCVGLPLALLLGFHYGLGVVGLWWGLCAGLMIVAVLLVIRFESLSARPIALADNTLPILQEPPESAS